MPAHENQEKAPTFLPVPRRLPRPAVARGLGPSVVSAGQHVGARCPDARKQQPIRLYPKCWAQRRVSKAGRGARRMQRRGRVGLGTHHHHSDKSGPLPPPWEPESARLASEQASSPGGVQTSSQGGVRTAAGRRAVGAHAEAPEQRVDVEQYDQEGAHRHRDYQRLRQPDRTTRKHTR